MQFNELLARRKEEIKARRATPLQPLPNNVPVKTTDADLDNVPMFTVKGYEDLPGLKIHDYRESIIETGTQAAPDFIGTLRQEWLITQSDNDTTPIKIIEETPLYKNGPRPKDGKVTKEYIADSVIASIGVEHTFEEFEEALEGTGYLFRNVIFSTAQGDAFVTILASEATLDTVDELKETLDGLGMCKVIDENTVFHTSNTTPNDPFYKNPFTLNGSTYKGQEADYKAIRMPEAWDDFRNNTNFIVAVCDGGILGLHPDLKANMWRNPAVSGQYNWGARFNTTNGSLTLVEDTEDIQDKSSHTHGTHVAGTIGAVGNNGIGGTGVNWKVQLMGLAVGGRGTTAIYLAPAMASWEWATERGAKVINNSWGGPGASNATMKAAARAAQEAGVILVIAAGNESSNNDSDIKQPADLATIYDNCISVAATDENKSLAYFSNYGPRTVSIAAPGFKILSTIGNWNSNFTQVDYDYEYLSGTSMASPHVAGAVSLIWGKHPNEDYLSIITRLYNYAATPSFLNNKVIGSRFMDVYESIHADDGGIMPPMTVSASKGEFEDKIVVNWSASSGATHYRLWYAESANDTKMPLTEWTTATTFTHTSTNARPLKQDINYCYWVNAATSSNGDNETPYSSMATGWLQRGTTYADEWDPADDTRTGATQLSVTTSVQTTPKHRLVYTPDNPDDDVAEDTTDYFKFTVSSANVGKMFSFKSNVDDPAWAVRDLQATIEDANGIALAYNDDMSDGKYDFCVSFLPQTAGTYYVRVEGWSRATEETYTMSYGIGVENQPGFISPIIELERETVSGTQTDPVRIDIDINDDEETWTFYPNNRPSWISEITIKDSDNQVLHTIGNSSVSYTFTKNVTLCIEFQVNTTSAARSWDDFLVASGNIFRILLTQEGTNRPAKPEGVTASEGDYQDRVKVHWNTVQRAKYYRVYRATSEDGTLSPVTAWLENRTDAYDTGMEIGQKYWYAVQASANVNGSEPSEYSDRVVGWAGELPETREYTLTVVNGRGSTSAHKGDVIEIEANNAPTGQRFIKWTGDTSTVDDVTKKKTTVTMPAANITVTASFVDEGNRSPFENDPIVRYPNTPFMDLYLQVTIDGQQPAALDWLAVYTVDRPDSDNRMEKRGEIILKECMDGNPVLLRLYWNSTDEYLKFFVWDSATNDILVCDSIGDFHPAMQDPGDPHPAQAGYSRENPLQIDVSHHGTPYGAPKRHPNIPFFDAFVKATLFGDYASKGDRIAVYCEDDGELRGVATVSNNEGKPIKLTIQRGKREPEKMITRIYDIDAMRDDQQSSLAQSDLGTNYVLGREYDALTKLPGSEQWEDFWNTTSEDMLGTPDSPVELKVDNDNRKLELDFNNGWTAFSFNLIPQGDDAKKFETLFGSDFNKVQAIQATEEGLSYRKNGYSDAEFTQLNEARQYWLHMAEPGKLTIENGVVCDETNCDRAAKTGTDGGFVIEGDKGISIVTYLPQEIGLAEEYFATLLEENARPVDPNRPNEKRFMLDHIEASSGGILYPTSGEGKTTLEIVKPGDVFWVFTKPGSKSTRFYSHVPSAQSLMKAREKIRTLKTLPNDWTVGTPWNETQNSNLKRYEVKLTYFGEPQNEENSNLYVAAFVRENEADPQSEHLISNPAYPQFNNLGLEANCVVSLDFFEGLSKDYTVYFKVFDEGNGQIYKVKESYKLSHIRNRNYNRVDENGRQQAVDEPLAVSVTEDGNSYPEYTITFVLDDESGSMTAELVKGPPSAYEESIPNYSEDNRILSQRIARNSSYKAIQIPRVCTSKSGYVCYFQVDDVNVTQNATYHVIFEQMNNSSHSSVNGKNLNDIDIDGDGFINASEHEDFRSLLNRFYGRNLSVDALYPFKYYKTRDEQMEKAVMVGRPHIFDTNQDWFIDATEYEDARSFIDRWFVNIKERNPDGWHGYGSGYRYLNIR